ncbi:AraC family transcriptional regulator [Amycolatopsis orientalis]|uniref:AraC family transcriptional regulator n=1 Tax=Amycolatopsis orientalis TaxID=31958 RepID=A0A193CC73_AMYOR|nr:AraC family transcriptional regulator [Amycolatopsis orientalis]ANN21963.1 AraC family transcriptional regulator [Amycolatopsis orientalis]
MDVLSEVLSVMRTGRPRSFVETWHAPWALRFPAVPGAVGFRVVVRGTCVVLPHRSAPVRLEPGDVVLLPHGEGHVLADSAASATNARPCAPTAVDPGGTGAVTVTLCGAYELSPAGMHPLLRDLPEIVHLTTHDRSELKAAVELLTGELTRPGLGTDGVIPALLDTLLHYALRAWVETTETGWATAFTDPAVAAALAAMHREPAHPWTVASLAALAGMSRAPFAKRFTDLTGGPPLRYLTWWRMTTAARLLRTTDAPLSTVAGKVGYHSEFAFATAFKRHYGTPPGKYRRSDR